MCLREAYIRDFVNADGQPEEQFTPEQLRHIIEQDLKRPWPKWAKLAAARLLHHLFPNLTATQWMECLESPDPFEKLFAIFDLPWLLGRSKIANSFSNGSGLSRHSIHCVAVKFAIFD